MRLDFASAVVGIALSVSTAACAAQKPHAPSKPSHPNPPSHSPAPKSGDPHSGADNSALTKPVGTPPTTHGATKPKPNPHPATSPAQPAPASQATSSPVPASQNGNRDTPVGAPPQPCQPSANCAVKPATAGQKQADKSDPKKN